MALSYQATGKITGKCSCHILESRVERVDLRTMLNTVRVEVCVCVAGEKIIMHSSVMSGSTKHLSVAAALAAGAAIAPI
jgi:hypothetical protein